MNKDIISFNTETGDLVITKALGEKLKNLLTTQNGSLFYAPEFGIDTAFWLDPEVSFQPDTFTSFISTEASLWGIIIEKIIPLIKGTEIEYNITISSADNTGIADTFETINGVF